METRVRTFAAIRHNPGIVLPFECAMPGTGSRQRADTQLAPGLHRQETAQVHRIGECRNICRSIGLCRQRIGFRNSLTGPCVPGRIT